MDGSAAPTDHMNSASAVDHFNLPVACVLCQRTVSPDAESEDLLAISLCGECKFLLLEDYVTQTDNTTHPTTPYRVRSRHGSSESIENLFSQQVSQMISPTTQSQSAPHFRTTPSGSRSWRRVLSDTESDGFDSLYQESESNFSPGGHRPFQFDNDSTSFTAYGGESDASVDGHSVLDADIINPLSYLDSDTDIDPMRAGPNQWNSDEREEDEESEEENNRSLLRRQRQTHFVGLLEDYHYLNVRGFNELFESLEEADNSRQGAPPAAVSFVNTLPRFVIDEGHLKHDSLTCAICKDFLSVGCVVNQLPCLHLYHPCCILPWLTARNSCPICRYELPTDDKDYEEGKRSSVTVTNLNEEDSSSSSDQNDDDEVDEFTNEYFAREDDNTGGSMRGRWLYLAGAPIVSLVGIIIVMWLKSPRDLPRGGSFFTHGSSSWVPNQRENRIRRWWSLF